MSLMTRAEKTIPGGVNSPVRAFKGVGGEPVFVAYAKGAYIFDTQENPYIDYVGSWGPMILGHTHPEVIKAVEAQIKKGLSFGMPTESEIELAELICKLMPSIEMLRMVNSGTEATMSAIRLARGFTGRDKIIKFKDCYHGHSDSLLVKAGSGALTLGIPGSAGVPESFAQHTLIAEFNDILSVQKLFEQYPDDIAGIIIEPVVGNNNCILPKENFLSDLRKICDQYNSLLIFDEVITGFRVALGGAQEKYKIKPDLTTLGKIIGGGMPVGAFGGRKDIMQKIAPLGPVYQAGTLSGNPVAMAAGLATLKLIQQENFYEILNHRTEMLLSGLQKLADKNHINFKTCHAGSLFGLYFETVEIFKTFFHGMLKEGIHFAPSAFESGFLSIAHEEKEIKRTLEAAEKVFQNMRS